MDHWFDDLAASLAVKTSRRRSLKLFAAGIGGVVAASVHGRLRHAAAKPTQAAPSVAYPPGLESGSRTRRFHCQRSRRGALYPAGG